MISPVQSENATNVAFDITRLFSALRASMVQQLYAAWFSMPDYRDDNLDAWLEAALPLIQAGEETSAVATTTYVNMQLQSLGLEPDDTLPDMAEVTGAAIRGGVSPEEVYARPFQEVWTALSKGKDIQDAIAAGANRLRQLVETDLQLSHTHTSRTILSRRSDVVGFRRVPTGVYTCALCLIASTQRYHKFDLMPIHPGCDCRVAPVIADEPVGQILDPQLLEEIHNAVLDQFGIDDRSAQGFNNILITREHGEYGPLLAVKGQHFTSFNDI